MKKEHYFKDNKTIVCLKTTGEFNIILWDLEKISLNFCPCCNKLINSRDLKKWILKQKKKKSKGLKMV